MEHRVIIYNVFIDVTIEADTPEEALELVQEGYWNIGDNAELNYDDAEYEVFDDERK